MQKEQRPCRCSFWLGASPWFEVPFDYVRKRFNRFNRFNGFNGFNGGGAAHKKEAPQSINNSDARRSLDSRFPVLNFPNIVRLTANDKDFSLALEMTIRESDVSKSLSHQSRIPPDI